jgi:Ca2+-binding EF-hand superfamily protein
MTAPRYGVQAGVVPPQASHQKPVGGRTGDDPPIFSARGEEWLAREVEQGADSREALLAQSEKKDLAIPPKWQTDKSFGDVPGDATSGNTSNLEKLVRGQRFDMLVSAIVALNILTLAFQIDYAGRYFPQEKPSGFKVAEVAFCIIYCVELAMRLAVFGLSYWCGKAINWFNCFDSSLVVLQVADLLYPVLVGSDEKLNSTGTLFLRIMRMARFARISRILHLVPNFRMLVMSILFSLKSLMWVILLISISTLIFGTILTQLVTDYRSDENGEVAVAGPQEEAEQQLKLQEYFGTLDRSMLVLYMIISDGIHWAEIAEPLEKCVGRSTIFIFITYSLLSVMAMMNVLTAFFVETAVKAGSEDKRAHQINDLWTLFDKQKGPTGDIYESDFIRQLDDPRMARFLKEMDLDVEHIENSHLFQILDRDKNGTVDLEELVSGCVRLTQGAKAIDVASLAYTFEQEQKAQDKFRQRVLLSLSSKGGPSRF